MGYYIRILALKTDTSPLADLRSHLPAGQELEVEVGEATEWSQLVLRHQGGSKIALIERNPVIPGKLGQAELNEFIQDTPGEKPESAATWLAQFLPRVKVIYAFQLLSGTETSNGWDGVDALRAMIWKKMGGIVRTDQEGISNEAGHQILWQFTSDHDAQ